VSKHTFKKGKRFKSQDLNVIGVKQFLKFSKKRLELIQKALKELEESKDKDKFISY